MSPQLTGSVLHISPLSREGFPRVQAHPCQEQGNAWQGKGQLGSSVSKLWRSKPLHHADQHVLKHWESQLLAERGTLHGLSLPLQRLAHR